MKLRSLAVALLLLLSSYASAQIARGSVTASTSACGTGSASAYFDVALPANVGAVILQVSGTYSATLQFVASNDGGTTYVSVSGQPQPSGTAVTSTTSTGAWQFNVAGFNHFCVYGSAYTSGTASLVVTYSNASTAKGGGGTVTPAGSSGNLQTNNGSGGLGALGTTISGSDITFPGNVTATGTISGGAANTASVLTLGGATATGASGIVGHGGNAATKPFYIGLATNADNVTNYLGACNTAGLLQVTSGVPGADCTSSTQLVLPNVANTFGSSGTLNLAAVTPGSFVAPVAAGASSTTSGAISWDSTANNLVVGGKQGGSSTAISYVIPKIISVQGPGAVFDANTCSGAPTCTLDSGYTFPANYFASGKTIRATYCLQVIGSASAVSATYRLMAGSTVLSAAASTFNPGNGVTHQRCIQYIVRSTGTSLYSVPIGNLAASTGDGSTTQPVAITVANTQLLQLIVAYTSNTAGNSTQVLNALLEELN